MKKAILLVAVGLVFGTIAACATIEAPSRTISSLDAHDLLVEGEATLIDVRLPNEKYDGAPENAVEIPYTRGGDDEKFREAVSAVSNRKTVILICRVGVRSRWAQEALRRSGISNTLSVEDGFSGNEKGLGWRGWGLPTKGRSSF